MDTNRKKTLLYACILALTLTACGSDSSSSRDYSSAPPADDSTVSPEVKSAADIAVYGNYDKNDFSEVSLADQKVVLLLDDDAAAANYAGLGLALPDASVPAAQNNRVMYKGALLSKEAVELKLQTESEKYSKQVQKAIEDQYAGVTINVLSNQTSKNGETPVVKVTISLDFASSNLNAGQSADSIRNLILTMFNNGNTPEGITSKTYEKGDKILLDLTFWVDIAKDRVFLWSGAYLDSHRDQVNAKYSDLRTGTALSSSRQAITKAHKESYTQAEKAGGVDILWSIDASGSMGEEQTNLANGAEEFFDALGNAGVDYRLAVNTQGYNYGPHSYNCTELRQTSEGEEFIDRNTISSRDKWKTLTKPGTYDSGYETAFYCVSKVNLSNFDRKDAENIVIFVSDEPENETVSQLRPIAADANYQIRDFSDYKAYFTQETNTTYFAIVGTGSKIRETHDLPNNNSNDENYRCYGEGGNATGGGHFKEIARLTGGSSASICAPSADWSVMFDRIIETATGLASNFILTQAPLPSTVKVTTNGSVVKRDITHKNGFDVIYGMDNVSLVFYGESFPKSGDVIEVTYDYISN